MALLFTFSSSVLLAQKSGGTANMTVSLTVHPICTVSVTAGPTTDQAVDVRCRNLPNRHPEPQVTDITEPGSAIPGQAGNAGMVVIHF